MTKPFINAQDSARSLQSDSQIKRAGTRMSQESKFKALIRVKLWYEWSNWNMMCRYQILILIKCQGILRFPIFKNLSKKTYKTQHKKGLINNETLLNGIWSKKSFKFIYETLNFLLGL